MLGGEHNSFESGGFGSQGLKVLSDCADDVVLGPDVRERRFLLKLGFSKPFVDMLAERAAANGTTLEAELLADGSVEEDAYFGALARVLELPFVPVIDQATVTDRDFSDTQLHQPRILRCYLPDQAPALAIVPSAREILDRSARIRSMPGLRRRIVVTTPTAVRRAVWEAGKFRRVEDAASRLFDTRPGYSARIVLTARQGFLAGLGLSVLTACLLILPAVSMIVIHVLLSSLYFLSLVIRGFAAHFGPYLTRPRPLEADDEDLPIYTVLVALHREADMAAQIVNRLNRLNWPRSKLDIKLLCEEDDAGTVDALRRQSLGPCFEIVTVPYMKPRTKPKALNYGLAGARGDLLVIYDAEDKPHPDQLREAYQHFRHAPCYVACLQAPLVISNARENWLAALFALEYAGLFRRMLPLLGALHLPMPLGGTSNHFRGLM